MRFLARFLGLIALAGAFAGAVVDGASLGCRWNLGPDVRRRGALLAVAESSGGRAGFRRDEARRLGLGQPHGARAARARLRRSHHIERAALSRLAQAVRRQRGLAPGLVTNPAAPRRAADGLKTAKTLRSPRIRNYLYSHSAPTPALDPPLASTPA